MTIEQMLGSMQKAAVKNGQSPKTQAKPIVKKHK